MPITALQNIQDSLAVMDALRSSQDSASSLSLVGFIVGSVGIAAGTTLLILDMQSDDGDNAKTAASGLPYLTSQSFGVYGTF